MSIVREHPGAWGQRTVASSCVVFLIASSLLLGACNIKAHTTSNSTKRVLGVSSGPLFLKWTSGPKAASFSGKVSGVSFSGTSGQASSTGFLPAFVAKGDFNGQSFKANLVAKSDGSSPLDFYFQVNGTVGSLKLAGKATYTLNSKHTAATLHVFGTVGGTALSAVVTEEPGSGSANSVKGTITVG